MAVRWRCPGCEGQQIEFEPSGAGTLECAACGCAVARDEALCVTCDAPGALRPRDSVHVQCRTCGTMQMIFAPARAV